MSVQSNKKVVRRLVEEVINGGDLEAFEELEAADYVDLSEESDPVGRDEYRNLVRDTRVTLADLHGILQQLAEPADT